MGYDVIVIGAGIVGLATAHALVEAHPELKVIVVEKESQVGQHQSGHNSGVMHSGVYYPAGSLKARLSMEGNQRMVQFCAAHGIAQETCGKVIVAADTQEIEGLIRIYRNGQRNGLAVEMLDGAGVRKLEPHIQGIAGIHVPSTGIVNYHQVCEGLASAVTEAGGQVALNTEVRAIADRAAEVVVDTSQETLHSRYMINCAGLFSDRIARLSGVNLDWQIIPFRGEYYALVPGKRHLIKNLVYPVPNPAFPFLGVHFTRMIGGDVEAGPNAVLGLRREGYAKMDVDLSDAWEALTFPGFWKLAGKYWRNGLGEINRSLSKTAFVHHLQRLLPELREGDLEAAPAGVRAQALRPDGSLVDDFLIVHGMSTIHVCNAPSPAASASLSIGQYLLQDFLAFST